MSIPYEEPGDSKWTWRVRVHLTHGTQFIHDGVPLERIEVPRSDGGRRVLRDTIKRRSHVRLTQEEYEKP